MRDGGRAANWREIAPETLVRIGSVPSGQVSMESASRNAHGADTSTENDLLVAVEDGRRFESLVIDLGRDSTTALPGSIGGGVFQEFGSSVAALYVEMWQEEVQLEAHIRSRGYERLLAIMETSAERSALHFSFVREMRGLRWVEQLRLGGRSAG